MPKQERFEYFPQNVVDDEIEGIGWFVRWRAKNGEPRMLSESYADKGKAKRAATKLSKLVPGSAVVEVTTTD